MKYHTLTSSIAILSGVGPKRAALFAQLGINTIEDLLLHAPSGYVDYSHLATIAEAGAGEPIALRGELSSVKSRRSFRNRKVSIHTATFSDDTGSIQVTWFNRFSIPALRSGPVYLTGVMQLVDGKKQISNPIVESGDCEPVVANHILAVYPLTKGLQQWHVRHAVAAALPLLSKCTDPLPGQIRVANKLVTWLESIRDIHAPRDLQVVLTARRRLAFDELLTFRLAQAFVARDAGKQRSHKITVSASKRATLLAQLPFQCTPEQQQVLEAVFEDIAKSKPARRLIQGEVGTGKTVIAGMALAATVQQGLQGLYLTPTDVLARQQYETLHTWLEGLGVKVALLTARTGLYAGLPATPLAVRRLAASGEPVLFVGTHAAVTHKTTFLKLGLVVIDEQHRFGVGLRHRAFQSTGRSLVPHTISMTATPIPRTLQRAMLEGFVYSTLHTPPFGKRRVHTAIVPTDKRSIAEARLRKRLQTGEQAFVVCPLIDPSDVLGVQSVQEMLLHLRHVLPDSTIAAVHGRLLPAEKVSIFADFKAGKIQVLVATTVIEVGIDVPAATIMVIEGAERFGLAQLHQLRGRVGRAGGEGFCLLYVTKMTARVLHRLRLFAKTDDAFRLAELDLSLRGPGEWFGFRQSGFPELRFADLSDSETRALADSAAETLLRIDPKGATYRKYYEAAQKLCSSADTGL
ncbi:MAG: ATP-dependent DNA helicase RecG [Patescibacteria group bacterium]